MKSKNSIFAAFLTEFIKDDNKKLMESLHEGFMVCLEEGFMPSPVPIHQEVKIDSQALELLRKIVQYDGDDNERLASMLDGEGATGLSQFVNMGLILDVEHKKEMIKELAGYSVAFHDAQEDELELAANSLIGFFYRK